MGGCLPQQSDRFLKEERNSKGSQSTDLKGWQEGGHYTTVGLYLDLSSSVNVSTIGGMISVPTERRQEPRHMCQHPAGKTQGRGDEPWEFLVPLCQSIRKLAEPRQPEQCQTQSLSAAWGKKAEGCGQQGGIRFAKPDACAQGGSAYLRTRDGYAC